MMKTMTEESEVEQLQDRTEHPSFSRDYLFSNPIERDNGAQGWWDNDNRKNESDTESEESAVSISSQESEDYIDETEADQPPPKKANKYQIKSSMWCI